MAFPTARLGKLGLGSTVRKLIPVYLSRKTLNPGFRVQDSVLGWLQFRVSACIGFTVLGQNCGLRVENIRAVAFALVCSLGALDLQGLGFRI